MLEIQTFETTRELIDRLYRDGRIERSDAINCTEVDNGCFYLLRGEGKSALCVARGEQIERVDTKGLQYSGLKPKDAEQSCMFYGLSCFELFVAIGRAGTGKTTIALAYALERLMKEDKRVVLCKPTVFVGRKSNAIGTAPGTHREKMEGYIGSYLVAMRRLVGGKFEQQLKLWEREGKVAFMPLELVRGMEFEDSTLIIDEAQNTTLHELMSLVSRVGKGSKVVVLGDTDQVDTGVGRCETGLWRLCESESFLDSPIGVGVRLRSQQRSALAELASEVLLEWEEK